MIYDFKEYTILLQEIIKKCNNLENYELDIIFKSIRFNENIKDKYLNMIKTDIFNFLNSVIEERDFFMKNNVYDLIIKK